MKDILGFIIVFTLLLLILDDSCNKDKNYPSTLSRISDDIYHYRIGIDTTIVITNGKADTIITIKK